MLIDTHCHLYVNEFTDDIHAVIERATAVGVTKFYLPAIDSETTDAMLQLEAIFPGKCHAMIGLHPCSVKGDYENELNKIDALLAKRKFVAIGESGLDFYWDKTFVKEQFIALEKQAEMALMHKLPIVLHTRNAMQETIDVIKNYVPAGLRGIFHCFGGSKEEARQIIDAGFLLGIGGVVTYKSAGLTEVLEHIELKHMVLETDSPYLTPVPFRGKRNESCYLKYVVEKLALIKNVAVEEVAAITTRNATELFNS